MGEHSLSYLLESGTITRSQEGEESTIDMIFVTQHLVDSIIWCKIHDINHGSDYIAIESFFDLSLPEKPKIERFLFKETPWSRIREKITELLASFSQISNTQGKCNRLIGAVLQAVQSLVPIARPSPYAKRWWNSELTQLRRLYSQLRNIMTRLRRERVRDIVFKTTARTATQQYHKAIQKQKKNHWDEFVAEQDNIWKIARCLEPKKTSSFSKVPPLIRLNDTVTEGEAQKASELFSVFYPPLSDAISKEHVSPGVIPIGDHEIEIGEIESKVFHTSPWKAPGQDGLLSAVWQRVWPVVKKDMLDLFRTSLNEGYLPDQWRVNKIIPLKKPNKPDYRLAKAWRPISLLATLGKFMDAVMAERLSYAAEAHRLLPENHFGARRRRSAEQALTLLQESIYKSWRSRRMLSLISFDVKGDYNSVLAQRLIQRMRARRIPILHSVK